MLLAVDYLICWGVAIKAAKPHKPARVKQIVYRQT